MVIPTCIFIAATIKKILLKIAKEHNPKNKQ